MQEAANCIDLNAVADRSFVVFFSICHGWKSYMSLYQNQMRNLGQNKITQGLPQQVGYLE